MPDADFDSSLKRCFVPLTTSKAITWIIVIGLIVYVNMLFNGFVWDDITYIVTNTDIRTLNIWQLFGPNYFNSLGLYRPIPEIYFALLHNLFGDTPFFYHIVQLILHIIASVLVYILFKKSRYNFVIFSK